MGTEGKSGFGSMSTAEDVTEGLNLEDYTAIVTGATAGIGLETARVLAKRGARVIFAVRNVKLGETLKAEFMKESPHARILVMHMNLSDLASVRAFAAKFKDSRLPLNILVNNGGISSTTGPQSTPDGLELMFATNFLGHFLLTELLLDTMRETAKESGIQGRIVIVSGHLHNFTPKGGIAFDKLINQNEIWGFSGYGQSKLAGILHGRELAERLTAEGANITVNSLHPGAVQTKLTHLDGFLGFLISKIAFHTSSKPTVDVHGPGRKKMPLMCTAEVCYEEHGTDELPISYSRALYCRLAAATQVYVATHPQVHGVTGKYFADYNEYELRGLAMDKKLQLKLWKWTEEYLKTH
nr:short-chain dehydrogenase TIC 32, chloroplastic-like [Physcomitrium patens]|eukprot:XP_024401285.1 short-chain dehydrogenase TIC 32, chloroplastic-like [Physcomitrella patens]